MIGTEEIFLLIVLLLGTIFWISVLIKIANTEKGESQKAWIIFVALTHFIGASIYFIFTQIKNMKGDQND
jgi:hypothetical protein